jgi:hypothetical protein
LSTGSFGCKRERQRLHIDGGEVLTSRILAKLKEQGTEVVINLPDVHSNTSIERRHKDVGGISNAQMHKGSAPAKLWEYSITWASSLINNNMSSRSLRKWKASRDSEPASRPLTPFEMVECGGERVDMAKMWSDMHILFTKCVGKIENVHIKKHGYKGMEGVYMGRISLEANKTQYGHRMLRFADMKIITVRTVTCYDNIFPFKMEPDTPIRTSSSLAGGQNDQESETKLDDNYKLRKEKSTNLGRIKATEKFPPGSEAMTVIGAAKIVARYADGDYSVSFPEAYETQEVRTVKRSDLWLHDDYPG